MCKSCVIDAGSGRVVNKLTARATVTSAVTSVRSEMSLPSLSSTSAGARCPSCFLASIVVVVCCRRRHLSRADMDKTRPAAAGQLRRLPGPRRPPASGQCGPSVRPSGRLMMRRPATRGYSAVSAVSDLSGINRRPTDHGRDRACPAPSDRRRLPDRPALRDGRARSATPGWMFAHVQSVYDQPTGHLYTQMIRRNPRRYRRRFIISITSTALFLPPSRMGSMLSTTLAAALSLSQVPAGRRRRKSAGAWWSHRRQATPTR